MESLDFSTTAAPVGVATDGANGTAMTTLKAEDIRIEYQRLENEVIPLGLTQIEVVMAMVPLDELKLDPTNPRIQFELAVKGGGTSPEHLRKLLWNMAEVKDLKQSIEANNGLIEAIIVSGKDGTVFEGNCRLTSYLMLNQLAEGKDPRWTHIRARILPPEVTRDQIDTLLGELHIVGKNKWSPFEQASHLYKMSDKGAKEDVLTKSYRLSKSYVSAKVRAYRLMSEEYIPVLRELKADASNVASKWSWFEEFYKACKPTPAGRTPNPDRVYDGPALEAKFCEWVADGKLPKAADVRKLAQILTNDKAIGILDSQRGKIDSAFEYVAAHNPAMSSKLWKQLELATDMLSEMSLSELESLRRKDKEKLGILQNLSSALERIHREVKK